VQKLIDTRRLIEAQASVAIVSGGGSGTYTITGHLDASTSCRWLQMMDAGAAAGGVDFENALTVLATVISRPAPERATSTSA
jgi:D-serine deaminase-like pyridoxal phosphate-dependent protein